MNISEVERTVLEVVGLSDGRWDTRYLDFEYYRRSQILLDPSLMHVLKGLESRGLVESVAIDGGTGPGWRLTTVGRHNLVEAR